MEIKSKMSFPLSAQLLAEIDEEPDDAQNIEDIIDEIHEIPVNYETIPGLREGSSLVWVLGERQLYYKKGSLKDGTQWCTCNVPKCNAKMFIRLDGSAYRKIGKRHKFHANGYEDYKMMYCFNKMKEKSRTAPACMQSFDIYREVVKE